MRPKCPSPAFDDKLKPSQVSAVTHSRVGLVGKQGKPEVLRRESPRSSLLPMAAMFLAAFLKINLLKG